MTDFLGGKDLPGAGIVKRGVKDPAADRESGEALLVPIGAPRLRPVGVELAILTALAIIGLFTGCSGSPGTASGKEAGRVAIAYTGAMSRLDFRTACELEFTNRHGPAYRGMSEAEKKRECESGWSHGHPLQPGASSPPELEKIKHLFGLAPAVLQSTEISGDSATVVLRNPTDGARRHVRLRLERDHWLVYEVEIGELISP
jgi:hypothetical protein